MKKQSQPKPGWYNVKVKDVAFIAKPNDVQGADINFELVDGKQQIDTWKQLAKEQKSMPKAKKEDRSYWNGKKAVLLTREQAKIYDAGCNQGYERARNERIDNYSHSLDQRKEDLDRRQKALDSEARSAKVSALKAAATAVDAIAHIIAEIGAN